MNQQRFVCKSCGIEKDESDFRVHKKGYRIGKCKECEREYQREWYSSKGEEAKAVKRKYMAKLRAQDPDAARARQREYHSRNREKQTAKMREYYSRRFFWGRAMKLRGPGRATAHDLAKIWKSQRGRCALTGRRLDRSAQLDHIQPRVKGGGDERSNLRWVCAAINYAKRDLTDSELMELCIDVVEFHRSGPNNSLQGRRP